MKRTKKAASALQPRARPGQEPTPRRGHSPDADAIRQAIQTMRERMDLIEKEFSHEPTCLEYRDALALGVWALQEQLSTIKDN